MIRALAMDFDGVLTDGTVTIDADGRESVTCSRVDGQGLWMLRKAGVAVCVITSQTPVLAGPTLAARRCMVLGMRCFDGVTDKLAVLDAWLASVGVSRTECAYAGDDLPDVPCMKAVRFPFAPIESRRRLHGCGAAPVMFSGGMNNGTADAGNGFVRALCDWIIDHNGRPEA